MCAKSLLTFSIAVFFIASCNHPKKEKNTAADKNLTPEIIEAESMELVGYTADKLNTVDCIKLTGSTGIARFIFPFPSGRYDMDVRYLSESIGQNSYVLYIAGNQIVAWLGKDRDDQWHQLSEQRWHTPRGIEINLGDEVRIEALSEKGSGVIFDYIEFRRSDMEGSTGNSRLIDSSAPSAEVTMRPDAPPLEDLVTVHPNEYEKAFRNPLKGFRPYTIYSGIGGRRKRFDPSQYVHEYGLLVKNYFKWNELENLAGDDVGKIAEVCNSKWQGVEKQNIKIIPRVYLAWPNRESGWPADMTEGDFTSPQFKERVTNLIRKLGEAWDNDPRVAYIEMGLIGEWGEMEWPDTRDEIKDAMAAQFSESFQHKLVMIRWPHTYNDHMYNFGYYWDSFAHIDQDYCGFHINRTAPKWETSVIGGEAAYNWGRVEIQPGRSPDESLKEPVHRDYIIDMVRKLHANHLGWIADYHQTDDSVRAGAAMLQKAMGYRFVISEVSYSGTISPVTGLFVSFSVKNTGSSPFYYNWPVEVSLLDPATRQPVWKSTIPNLDIRTWLPGDQWDEIEDSYAVPAETFTVNQTFSIQEIPAGSYILSLAILDPAGNRPCVRFAINNYYTGGRHPIGMVGVGHKPETFTISGFDDIQSDTTLYYELAR